MQLALSLSLATSIKCERIQDQGRRIMCGIVGYIGQGDGPQILLDALRRLEYRGYDSSGIAALDNGRLSIRRKIGKLQVLADHLAEAPLTGTIGIGHTRWATHGGVTEANAHPHQVSDRVAIVHNGIIENHKELRARLSAAGHIFTSDTDSEVIAHLFVDAFDQGLALAEAMAKVLSEVEGAYALAVMSVDYPDQLIVARNASPLAIGLSDEAVFVASDAVAMAHLTQRVIYLKDGDYAVLGLDGHEVFDADGTPANREIVTVAANPVMVDKAGYRHFMEKEIHEQPEAIAHTLSAMTDEDGHLSAGLSKDMLGDMSSITLLAAGTSFYAGQIGRYWIEKLAGVPVACEVASEYRYRHPVALPGATAIAISQSGESLDTLMAMRHAAEQGMHTIGIVNVAHSTIAREADAIMPTRAGAEIGVASTKAFTAQLTVLLSLAIALAEAKGKLSKEEAAEKHQLMMQLPRAVGQVVGLFDAIRPIAHGLSHARSCLFLGRGTLFPLALEGALKLKELSYIHAEGFASGEMKHGPIALIEDGLPVVSLLCGDELSLKAASNLQEAAARGASIILIGTEAAVSEVDFADRQISIPDCDPLIAPIILAIPAQILAYLTAVEKGTDVDQPRNLAKSVTVE